MTLKQEVLEHETIFSLMYSPTFVDSISLEDQIVEIEVSKLQWYENEEGFGFRLDYLGGLCSRYPHRPLGPDIGM